MGTSGSRARAGRTSHTQPTGTPRPPRRLTRRDRPIYWEALGLKGRPSGQRWTRAGLGAAPVRQFAIGEGLQVVNSTRGPTLARVSQWERSVQNLEGEMCVFPCGCSFIRIP